MVFNKLLLFISSAGRKRFNDEWCYVTQPIKIRPPGMQSNQRIPCISIPTDYFFNTEGEKKKNPMEVLSSYMTYRSNYNVHLSLTLSGLKFDRATVCSSTLRHQRISSCDNLQSRPSFVKLKCFPGSDDSGR